MDTYINDISWKFPWYQTKKLLKILLTPTALKTSQLYKKNCDRKTDNEMKYSTSYEKKITMLLRNEASLKHKTT